jgi:DNA-binding MarR family transcriptional regulator
VDAVADRLQSAAIHLSRRLRAQDEALGISAPRLSALSMLVFTGPQRVGQLARAEQVEPPTMTRLVDGLERDGYVAREPDPDDARAVRVRVTDAGVDALTVGKERRVAAFVSMLGTLPPRDLASLGRGIEALERALDPHARGTAHRTDPV